MINAHPALRRPAAAFSLIDEIINQARPAGARAIPMSFYESASAYLVRASLPGFAKENISVEVENETLTVKAKREQAGAPEGMTFLAGDPLPLEVSRSIALPETVDSDGATASMVDGILELRLPKRAPARRLVKID